MQHVVVIIPTYNEAKIIAKTITDVQAKTRHIQDYAISLLIFDSNSTDNTQTIVKSLQQQHDNIYLETEPGKSGLGSAYIQAMQFAIQILKADIIFEFDADGSHQPKYIPEMLSYFNKGFDMVNASRFVDGGKLPDDWSWDRRLLSVLGNYIARLFLTNKIKDHTSGFRATRARLLEKIELNKIISKNYAYKIQLIWEAYCLGAKIVEHPIEFIDRTEGQSKFPKHNARESLLLVLRLSLRRFTHKLKPQARLTP